MSPPREGTCTVAQNVLSGLTVAICITIGNRVDNFVKSIIRVLGLFRFFLLNTKWGANDDMIMVALFTDLCVWWWRYVLCCMMVLERQCPGQCTVFIRGNKGFEFDIGKWSGVPRVTYFHCGGKTWPTSRLNQNIKMAQGKVTEFFSSRKRNASLQPSKRRKVQRLETPETTEQIETPVIPVEKNVRITRRAQKCNTIDSKTKSVSSVKQTRRNTRTKNKKAVESQGKDISSFFNASPEHTVDSDETTAVRDDHHASPISTPTKSVPKRGLQKTQIKDVLDEINSRTPESEKAYDFAKFVKPKVSPEVSARRKLQLQRKASPKDVVSSAQPVRRGISVIRGIR